MDSLNPQAVRTLTNELHSAANLLTTPSPVAHLMIRAATTLEWYAQYLENPAGWRVIVGSLIGANAADSAIEECAIAARAWLSVPPNENAESLPDTLRQLKRRSEDPL